MNRLRPVPASGAIEEKIATKHRIEFDELDQMFENEPVVLRGTTDAYSERRYSAFGETDGGRLLMAVFTIPETGIAKIITARDMTAQERRRYRRTR